MTPTTIFDANVLLPGLNLVSSKDVEVPDEVKSLTNDGSIIVCLKKLDGKLSLFRDENIFLEATYQSRGTPSNSGASESVENPTNEDDKMEPGGDGEDPWGEELDIEFDNISYEDKLVEEWEWVKKRVDSPFIDGYESFLLKPEGVWKSTEKTIEDMELCFFFTETDAIPSESLDPSENRGVEVGEKFVIDYADAVSRGVLLLEWDFDCILMKEVSSPEETDVLKRETEICDEVLLLGMHGLQNFEPSESLAIHVHLNDYLSGHGNLKLKLYPNCEIEPDSKKAFDDMVDNCIKKSCTCDSIGSFSASGIFGDYIKFEIDPTSLLQMLQALVEPDDDGKVEPVESIVDAIEAAQFAAIVEDGNSSQFVAEFLLSSIASNNIYFDSAVQMLKSPENRSRENITNWSRMVTRTAESIWDLIFTHADYKLTRFDSKPLDTDIHALQEFQVRLALPDVHPDVATIDPYNDIAILVENCDSDLSFVDRSENRSFLHVLNPTKQNMSGDDHVIEFNWKCIDRRGVERNCETKVSILIGVEEGRRKKMGKTVSIFREVGGASKQHIAQIRLRHMVKMGFEHASGVQCSFSHFLETTFKMVFAFSTNEVQTISSRTFLDKAADDIASRFYKAMADGGGSDIYDTIRRSALLSSRDFENTKVIEESEVAEFVVEIFGSLSNYTDDLLDWAASMKADEDSLRLVEGNETIDDLLQKHVENLRQVLRMDATELASQLRQHQELMQVFVAAAQLTRDEIDNPKIDEDEQFPSKELNTPESDLAQMLNESSARNIEFQAQEILENMEKQIPLTAFSDAKVEASQVLTENVSAMETNLLLMLETTADSCDAGISFLEDSEMLLDDVSDLLTKLRNFASNIKTLSNNAKSLNSFIHRFWNALKALSKIALGPLAAIKTIVSAIKIPIQMILKALDKGAVKIRSLATNVDKKLKALVTKTMIDKVNKAKRFIGKPKPALEKVVEIVDMLISVASMGILPMSLISQFASSNSLKSFFQTLSDNSGLVKSTLDNIYKQTAQIQPYLDRMRDLSNSVASKFSFLRPLDAGLKKFQPFVDTIRGLYRRFSGWFSYLLAAAMWPVEQAINLILYPFRSQINRMIERLNPFSAIDAIMVPLVAPLRDITSSVLLTDRLNIVEAFENIAEGEEFKNMANSLTLCVAIIQRGLYGLVEGLLMQGSDNVEFFQELMGGADSNEFGVIKQIMTDMQFESPVVTMGDAILSMKESIHGPLQKCNSYLLMNASNDHQTFRDSFTDNKLASYVKSSDYDLAYCAIDPSSDKSSALFEYGKEDENVKNSWMMASMAVILHFGKVTEQAVHIGALSSESEILISFIPEDKGSGRYSVSLHPKIDGSMQSFDVDSRLPLQNVVFPPLTSFEEFPTDVFDYANKRINAEVYPVFSEKYSLALVEKVIACELDMIATESVGTAMHLLCGKSSGYCYVRGNSSDEWWTYIADGPARKTEKYDTVALQSTGGEKKTEKDLINLLKTRSMSKEQVELLDSLYRSSLNNEGKSANSFDRFSLEEAMSDLSMFVVVTAPPTTSLKILDTSVAFEVDFSVAGLDLTSSKVDFYGGAKIEDNGGVKALRIDTSEKKAVLDININPNVMPNCTIVIGVYLESIQNKRGWVLSTDNGGYDRSIVLHDDRFKGMGMPSGSNTSVWKNNNDGQPREKKWMHIAAVYSQSNRSYFYTDGSVAPMHVTANNSLGRENVTIGTNPLDPSSHWCDCWVKEVKIYNRALNANEIKELHNQFQKDIDTTVPTHGISNGIAHPILYTDNTPGTNIVYADGSKILPLYDLSNISEVWEYTITNRTSTQPDDASIELDDSISEPDDASNEPNEENSTGEVTSPGWDVAEMAIYAVTRIIDHTSCFVQEVHAVIAAYIRGFLGLLHKRPENFRIIHPASSPIAKITDIGALDGDDDPTKKYTDRMQMRARVKKVVQKAIRATVKTRISYSKVTQPREIALGDYVKSRTRNLEGKVIDILREDKKVGSKGKKTRITDYKIKPYATNAPTTYKLTVDETKKFTDEEKQIEIILRREDIFFGRTLLPPQFKNQAQRRQWLQWNSSPSVVQQNAKFCGITFGELKRYVNYCKTKHRYLWSKCIHKRGHKPSRNRKKFVSVDDLCQNFIRPQTQGLRSCIALNMKNVLTDIAAAEVFVSLSWEEDIEQVIDMLEERRRTTTKIGRTGRTDFTDDTVLWLSAFSLYQGDGPGSLADQLGIDIFQAVLKSESVTDMFVIQTGVCNSYARLWCVSEFSAAIENNVKIHHIFSRDWKEKYIRNKITGFKYGWDDFEFGGETRRVYRKLISDEDKERKIRLAGEIPVFFNNVNYYLMEEEEFGQGSGGPQPVLRLNVQSGLREFAQKRDVDDEEFRRLDTYNVKKHERWWSLQKTIVELERTAANAEDYKPYYTLSQEFTNRHEPKWGSNVDIIRRVQNDDGSIEMKSKELLEGFVPRILPDLDRLGRLFLEFKTDEQAEIYFEKVLGLDGGYDPKGVKNLLSFGANEELLGEDKEKFSFPNIERLAKELDSTYVDSLRLPPLAASYKLEPEKNGDVKHPRNIFWAKYYQKAMREATTMVFVITAGWLGSKNCWEEMGWAAELRKNTATKTYKTILVFSNEKHFKEMEEKKIFKFTILTKEGGTKEVEYNWLELKEKIGFTLPIITAKTVDEIRDNVAPRIPSS